MPSQVDKVRQYTRDLMNLELEAEQEISERLQSLNLKRVLANPESIKVIYEDLVVELIQRHGKQAQRIGKRFAKSI
jgi:hypothetical protein